MLDFTPNAKVGVYGLRMGQRPEDGVGPQDTELLSQMESRLMSYPSILRLLAHQHGIPLERAYKLWDRAAAHSTAAVGLTPVTTPDWDRVMSSFLESIR